MSDRKLGHRRALRGPMEKDHTLENEAMNLYKNFHKLFQKILGRGTEEDVEKIDDLIYNIMKIIEIKFFKLLRPLVIFIRNYRKNSKKNDKIRLKRNE